MSPISRSMVSALSLSRTVTLSATTQFGTAATPRWNCTRRSWHEDQPVEKTPGQYEDRVRRIVDQQATVCVDDARNHHRRRGSYRHGSGGRRSAGTHSATD